MKKRKIALAIAAFVCSATACIAIAGCTHTHDFSELKHDETTHWYECSCGEKQTAEEHKGGTATCTEKAECEICHEEYGGVLGHNYGEVAYVWNGDKCTATKECANNSAHKITQTLTGTYVKDTDATCTANEKGHYEVTFTTEGLGAASTKANSVEKPDSKLNHTLDTTEESIEWNWSADCTSATVGCTDCEYTQDFTAEASIVSSTATCTVPGTVTYKATITVGDKTISNEKTVDAKALGHNLKWDTSNTDKDVGTCQREGCTHTVEFNKKVTATNQDLLMTDTTISIDLTGISAYESVEGIKLTANDVEYDLGKDITALNVTELKKAPQAHGVQTIVVTVKDSNDGVHAVNVPVTIITAKIGVNGDTVKAKQQFQTLIRAYDYEDKYGYYILDCDLDLSDFENSADALYRYVKRNNATGTENAGDDPDPKQDGAFRGTLIGNGHTITHYAKYTASAGDYYDDGTQLNANGIFVALNGAHIENLKVNTKDYDGNWRMTTLARSAINTTFKDVTVTLDQASDLSATNKAGSLVSYYVENTKWENVKVVSSKKIGSLFGYIKGETNQFDIFVDSVAGLDKVSNITAPETQSVAIGNELADGITLKQYVDLKVNPLEIVVTAPRGVVSLGDYEGWTVKSIESLDGTAIAFLNASDIIKAYSDVKLHGNTSIKVDVEKDGVEVGLTVPVLIVTSEISTLAELEAAVRFKGTDLYGYYKLVNDIDAKAFSAASTKVWGSENKGFKGTLDGCGHKVTIQNSAGNGTYGLFGTLQGATVKNLTIDNVWYGGDYGQQAIAMSAYNSTLENVTVNVIVGSSSDTINWNAAPIFAESGNVTWKDCTINLKVQEGKKVKAVFGTVNKDGNTDSYDNVIINVTANSKDFTVFAVSLNEAPTGVKMNLA